MPIMLNHWVMNIAKQGLLAGLLVLSGHAMASGLQVSPITLTLQATQNAGGLTLSNTGDEVVNAQVRVYHWSQKDNRNQLTASRALLASPPMITLNPGEQQLIRVIRTSTQPKGAVEDAFRLSIDELPTQPTTQKNGLQFVLSYSLPVFVQSSNTAARPALQWHLKQQIGTEDVLLQVSNNGTAHAQLAGLYLIDSNNQRIDINKGLLGYVLPGATMSWPLKLPIDTLTGGTFKVMINGDQTTPSVTLDHPTH